jgi:hypothetical protein
MGALRFEFWSLEIAWVATIQTEDTTGAATASAFDTSGTTLDRFGLR